jgi:hypothetical protein
VCDYNEVLLYLQNVLYVRMGDQCGRFLDYVLRCEIQVSFETAWVQKTLQTATEINPHTHSDRRLFLLLHNDLYFIPQQL